MGLERYCGSNKEWGEIVPICVKRRIGEEGIITLLALYELGLLAELVPSEHTLEGRINYLCDRYASDRRLYFQYVKTGEYVGRVKTLKIEGEPVDFLEFFCLHGGRSGMGLELSSALVYTKMDEIETKFKEGKQDGS